MYERCYVALSSYAVLVSRLALLARACAGAAPPPSGRAGRGAEAEGRRCRRAAAASSPHATWSSRERTSGRSCRSPPVSAKSGQRRNLLHSSEGKRGRAIGHGASPPGPSLAGEARGEQVGDAVGPADGLGGHPGVGPPHEGGP